MRDTTSNTTQYMCGPDPALVCWMRSQRSTTQQTGPLPPTAPCCLCPGTFGRRRKDSSSSAAHRTVRQAASRPHRGSGEVLACPRRHPCAFWRRQRLLRGRYNLSGRRKPRRRRRSESQSEASINRHRRTGSQSEASINRHRRPSSAWNGCGESNAPSPRGSFIQVSDARMQASRIFATLESYRLL